MGNVIPFIRQQLTFIHETLFLEELFVEIIRHSKDSVSIQDKFSEYAKVSMIMMSINSAGPWKYDRKQLLRG